MADTQETFTVDTAIEDSIRESRIVHIEDVQLDTQNFVRLADELSSRADDWTEYPTDGGLVREYWGTDDDGDNWRIHLHCVEVSRD